MLCWEFTWHLTADFPPDLSKLQYQLLFYFKVHRGVLRPRAPQGAGLFHHQLQGGQSPQSDQWLGQGPEQETLSHPEAHQLSQEEGLSQDQFALLFFWWQQSALLFFQQQFALSFFQQQFPLLFFQQQFALLFFQQQFALSFFKQQFALLFFKQQFAHLFFWWQQLALLFFWPKCALLFFW